MNIKAIDLFCGTGGLTHGLKMAGIDVLAGIDVDPACEWGYERNNQASYLRKDIADISHHDINSIFGQSDIRMLAGCAPCQPFSSYGRTRKREDDRWALLLAFERLVAKCKPELVTMENVPGLAEHRVFESFVGTLDSLGYWVGYNVLCCEQLGLPQTRRRLVLVASRLGEIHAPQPNERLSTVRQAIGNLPPIRAGETHDSDRFHKSASLSPINLQRIKASTPGGTWKDWPESLVSKCHKARSGKSYPSVYGRMEWDRPSPTITTQCYGYGNGRFGHPEQDRAISLREAALLQSFPRNWEFVPESKKVTFADVGRMIGNAVPPVLGEEIGRCFQKHIRSISSGYQVERILSSRSTSLTRLRYSP